MSDDRLSRTDQDRAERLLGAADAGPDRVARLLAAARAPAQGHELAGEEAAAFAFRTASVSDLAGRPRHAAARGGRWARVVGLKVAAVTLAVAAGGVALAAGTGVLPLPIIKTSSPATDPAGPSSKPAGPTSSHADQRTGGPAGEPGPASPTGSAAAASGAEHAAMVGLCRAYQAQDGHDPGKSMDGAAFAELVAAAGGEDEVAAYCATILAEDPDGPAPQPAASPAGGAGSSHHPAARESS